VILQTTNWPFKVIVINLSALEAITH